MPKLYLNLTPADDGSFSTADPIRLLYVGTAAELLAMTRIVKKFLIARGFSDDMDQKHQPPAEREDPFGIG